MYVDPNGEWVYLVIGAVFGGIMNLGMNTGNIDNFWQVLGYFSVGAIAGAIGAGVGAGISSSIAVSGSFKAGFMGTSAAARGRNLWTGSSKTYQLQRNQIVSIDGMFEEYAAAPDKAFISNTDTKRVYYKPSEGAYGIADYVDPGGFHYDPIDGVATSKSKYHVFKVPNHGKVKVLPSGDVVITNPKITQASANLAGIRAMARGDKYLYGWLKLSELDNGWKTLFEMAGKIK
jgi:hypothetical protein